MAQDHNSGLDESPSAAEAPIGTRAGALRASEQRREREFGRMPIGILATRLERDRPNAYLTVNDAFCQLTGYSREELSGGDFLGDLHPDEQPALEA